MNALTDLTKAILWNRAPINSEPLEVLDYLEVRNNEHYELWRIKYQRNLKMTDLRGDITGPTIDNGYAMKRMVARAIMKDILSLPSNVVKFRRKK